MTGDDISDAAEIRWKLGPTHSKAKCLLMRLATKSKYHICFTKVKILFRLKIFNIACFSISLSLSPNIYDQENNIRARRQKN